MNLLKSMQLFVLAVDKGSLTAAADEAGLTPTMVGNHLRALEEHVGMQLLNRTTRQQHLTAFGAHYYDRCVEILGLVQASETLASSARAEPQGRLRVTIPHAFGAERLMPALQEYLAQYPKVELEISFTDRLVDLLEEGFEAAIRIGELPDSGLIAQMLQPHDLVVCAAPAYLQARPAPSHPAQLVDHDCLTYQYATRSALSLWRLVGPDGEHGVRIKGRVQMDNGPALREAALAGMGITLLPQVVVERDIESGRLRRVLPEYCAPARPLHVLYLPDRQGSPKLRSFIRFMVERFGSPL